MELTGRFKVLRNIPAVTVSKSTGGLSASAVTGGGAEAMVGGAVRPSGIEPEDDSVVRAPSRAYLLVPVILVLLPLICKS